MTSREYILQKIKENKPELSPLPDIPDFERNDVDLVQHFTEVIKFVGGRVETVYNIETVINSINHNFSDCKQVVNLVSELKMGNVNISAINDPHELKTVELAIIKGEFGVSENGAIWFNTNDLVHRALPFITQHLVVILRKESLVWNMHQAYNRIENSDINGYGVFISGPSKTADIEQSLVIGAHGSRSLIVYLV
ncbi:MAG: LUD domain-containing protein [Bacteroidota bacterium]|nr:LUD domain-containing protein [Bacteroidota bacterium]